MRITVVRGDITTQTVDAIVNAANSALLGGGGVDGAIHRAGAARWVIHTVGPVYTRSPDPALELASCFTESLRVPDEVGAQTVAFPAVSTGVYGYPITEAAQVSVAAVRAAITEVKEARFVLFNDESFAAYDAASR